LPELKEQRTIAKEFQATFCKPFHVDSLEPPELLRSIRESVDHSEPIWLWLD
jgi:hypothetical protein